MKPIRIATCFIILLSSINLMLIFILIGNSSATPASTKAEYGSIIITVLEQGSLTPITNATVCVVETRKYYSTNNKGLTEKISVPILTNSNFDNSLKRNYGEITLLVYKNGYTSELSFGNIISPNTTRVGLIIFLTPIINPDDPDLNISSQNPDTSWATELYKLYKK
ncbi:MAG: hypothetical protein IJS68_02500 [Clostridia bacterium]|nr:hypothetical protein [Clostridia bacterium]